MPVPPKKKTKCLRTSAFSLFHPTGEVYSGPSAKRGWSWSWWSARAKRCPSPTAHIASTSPCSPPLLCLLPPSTTTPTPSSTPTPILSEPAERGWRSRSGTTTGLTTTTESSRYHSHRQHLHVASLFTPPLFTCGGVAWRGGRGVAWRGVVSRVVSPGVRWHGVAWGGVAWCHTSCEGRWRGVAWHVLAWCPLPSPVNPHPLSLT